MRLLILLGATLAGVLLFLLATASGNTSVFANHYPLLLGLNAALAALPTVGRKAVKLALATGPASTVTRPR
jgi:hypothetical protein